LDDDKVARLRARAWIGDAVHTLDVRCFVLSICRYKREYQHTAQRYLTAAHQSRYLRQRGYSDLELRGSNDNLLSEAFEAAYFGEFRTDYIAKTFGELAYAELPYDIGTDFCLNFGTFSSIVDSIDSTAFSSRGNRVLNFRFDNWAVAGIISCALVIAFFVVVWK